MAEGQDGGQEQVDRDGNDGKFDQGLPAAGGEL